MFPKHFCNILQKGNKNILNLLACGALSSQKESRKDEICFSVHSQLVTNDKLIIWFLFTSQLFDKILCFSQPNFQPSTTHKFVMDLALNQFIFNCINFVHLIREHQALGAHTDIIVFQATTVKTYRWSHPGACPMGNRSSNQCTKCHRLKTLSPKRENEDQFKIVLSM